MSPIQSNLIFQYGNYGTVIGIYQQKFPKIHLVDGALHIKSDSEFKQLIDYFGLDSSRLKFKFNPEKGFLCLHEPIRFCLDNLKGNTRKESTLKDKIEKYPELERWIDGYRGEFTSGWWWLLVTWKDGWQTLTSSIRKVEFCLAELNFLTVK